ncbi:MAG TPA: antibiotic biosynthesis monooxygenase [Steroidobacter sp.]|uniref:antibiotic biosynthesis monooxygenase family protein n=1 Tax=Steroidobacter sp. TaxID=1978227 RepID=UPI002ED83462
MIIREWRGRALRDKAGEYPTHFRKTVVPELRKVPGFLGATLSRREEGDRIEFLVLSGWESMEAIRAFAGDNLDKAVVEPGAVAALSDYDQTVRHYEVVADIDNAPETA